MGLRCLSAIYDLKKDSLAAIMTLDDRNDARNVYEGFQDFAAKKQIALFVAKDRTDSERIIREIKPDLCLVVGWYWLFSKETLGLAGRGFVGIHNSLLPKYRGGSPLVWAMINGEKRVGLSLFSMTEGMDDGPVWGQKRVRVGDNDQISQILERLESKALELLQEKYSGMLEGTIRPVRQNVRSATYCAQRFPGDGMIDWRKPAKEIHDFVRAQSDPYPGAFTTHDAKKLLIWRAHLVNMTYYGTPGQVARAGRDGVYVICGDHRPLVLDIVELEGGSREAANTIVKSFKTRFRSPS